MKDIISKLLMGTITDNELIELRNWLNNPKNQSILESYIVDYHDLNLSLLKNNVDAAYKKVVGKIDRNERPVKRLFPNWARYAAAVVLLFGIGFFYQQGFFAQKDKAIIIPKDESITLELDNGEIQTIDISQTGQVKDSDGNVIGSQQESGIRYSDATHTATLVFNKLNVPKGKRFQLELSDGSTVHLNAGSSLRYPINFSKEGSRQVYLTGEAYFKITEDQSKPFIVNVEELQVKVLGTEFNASAYQEDNNVDLVLVKGLVNLVANEKIDDKSTKLSPGQKGSFEYNSQNISVSQVDTSLYTSWMQGDLVFRDLSFENILTKLERHYNIEIENTNIELGKEVFNASFNKVDIDQVLSFFNDTHEIHYNIINNKVIIN